MPRWLCTRSVWRTIFCSAIAVAALSLPSYAQDSEHSDPLTVDNPADWHEAYVPPSFGVIAYGALPVLFGAPAEGTSRPNSLRAGVSLYYDAWQVGFEMRPEATYVRLMPRTIGRDAYVAAVLEMGFASAKGLSYNYSTGNVETENLTETRYGMGISARTGRSEEIGVRFLFDGTFGLATHTTDAGYSIDNTFYYTFQVGALLRVPIGPIAINAGPYIETGTGNLLVAAGDGSSVLSQLNESFFSGGIQVEIALNLNRPQYLTGAQ
jgi:hypothetical protein